MYLHCNSIYDLKNKTSENKEKKREKSNRKEKKIRREWN